MSRFEFISVLVSVLVAIALAEIVTGWGRILRHWRSSSPYWLHLLWTALGFLILSFVWFTYWDLVRYEPWTYPRFLLLLLTPTIAVLLAFVITPQDSGHSDRPLDLKGYYFDQAPLFFSLAALFMLSGLAEGVVLRGFRPPVVAVQGIAIALLLVLASARAERTHVIISLGAVGLFLMRVLLKIYGQI